LLSLLSLTYPNTP